MPQNSVSGTKNARDGNWVLWSKDGSLDSLQRHLDIKRQLRESARRLKQQVTLHRQIYPEFSSGR